MTNKIGAAMTVFSSIGADVWPLLTGRFIENTPMIFMYLTLGPLASCFVMFLIALTLGSKFRMEKDIENPEKVPFDGQKDPVMKRRTWIITSSRGSRASMFLRLNSK